jgi:hypothetical protein
MSRHHIEKAPLKITTASSVLSWQCRTKTQIERGKSEFERIYADKPKGDDLPRSKRPGITTVISILSTKQASRNIPKEN